MSLNSRAMLVSIRISTWSGRKLDKEISQEVNRDHGARRDVARVTKKLLDSAHLKNVESIAAKARNLVYAKSAPWLDSGTRIVSSAGYMPLASAIAPLRAEFESAVELFLSSYADEREKARIDLNGMFKDSDFPPARALARKFGFDMVGPFPVPTAGDFRVDMGDAATAAIRADIERQVTAGMQKALGDAYARIAETVGHMAEKLSTYSAGKPGERVSGQFKKSMISNVSELIDLLPALNISGDAALDSMVSRMRDLVKHDADFLRENPDVRREIAEKAVAIQSEASRIAADAADLF